MIVKFNYEKCTIFQTETYHSNKISINRDKLCTWLYYKFYKLYRGYLGPGGVDLMTDGSPSPNCIGGATRQIDLWVVGGTHIYQNPTAKRVYSSAAFDPEGVLGKNSKWY